MLRFVFLGVEVLNVSILLAFDLENIFPKKKNYKDCGLRTITKPDVSRANQDGHAGQWCCMF